MGDWLLWLVCFKEHSFLAFEMGDTTNGALFNKCDPVGVGISSNVSLENKLFSAYCKIYQQISTNKRYLNIILPIYTHYKSQVWLKF